MGPDVSPLFLEGEVSMSDCVLWWLWLGRFGHSTSAFSPLLRLASYHLPISHLSLLLTRLYKAFSFLNNNQNNTKNKSIEDHRVWSWHSFEVTTSSDEGCLHTLRLLSHGGELTWNFFFFSLKNRDKNEPHFKDWD